MSLLTIVPRTIAPWLFGLAAAGLGIGAAFGLVALALTVSLVLLVILSRVGHRTMSNDLDADRKSSQSWYWWGIPTFFRCPWNEDPAAADIALVGVPHSSGNGSTERDQHLGPRAVRNVSGFYRRAHGVHGFSPWDVARVNDLGDVPLPEAMNNEASVRDIEAFYAQARSSRHPASVSWWRSLDHRADHQGDCRAGPQALGGPSLARSSISTRIPIPTTTCPTGWAPNARRRIGRLIP